MVERVRHPTADYRYRLLRRKKRLGPSMGKMVTSWLPDTVVAVHTVRSTETQVSSCTPGLVIPWWTPWLTL